MKDIQNQRDTRKIDIKKVGVKKISYPIILLDKEARKQHTVASVNMFVNLPHQFKGTHMSRFLEILNQFHGQIDLKNFRTIMEQMKERLDAKTAHFEIDFPFFINERSQTAKKKCYHCSMHGSTGSEEDFYLQLTVPYEYSRMVNGQKRSLLQGKFTIRVRFHRFIWIEDIVLLAEQCLAECNAEKGDELLTLEKITNVLYETLAATNAFSRVSVHGQKRANGYTEFVTVKQEVRDSHGEFII